MAGIASEYATSKNKLGVALGLSGRQVANLLDEGMPGKTAKGFDVAKCQAWLAAKRAPKEKPLASYDERMAAAELRKAEAQALREELKAKQAQGALIEKQEVLDRVGSLLVRIRDRLQAIPAEITVEMSTDVREVWLKRWEDRSGLILTEMSQWSLEAD